MGDINGIVNLEELSFDSKLLNLNVGRIDLSNIENTLNRGTEIQGLLHNALTTGINVVYIFSPYLMKDGMYKTLPPINLPGIHVDEKTTYKTLVASLKSDVLLKDAYSTPGIRISFCNQTELNPDNELSKQLIELAVAAGEWSRFKVDSNMPSDAIELMYTAWLKNSLNKSLADETLIATEIGTNELAGLVTVKLLPDKLGVNVGLLATSVHFRRRGIAIALLSRVALWTLERTNWSDKSYLNVVTQGGNQAACRCYEKFGFVKQIIQNIYHTWLPMHYIEPKQVSDRGMIPYCRQYLTGKEIKFVSEIFKTGHLDSAARYTTQCVSSLQSILGKDAEKIVVVPSGTAALEMAALLIDLQAGDEVIMPSYTFSSTANAMVLRGAVPVFVDIRADTLNINELLIEAAITPRTKAICCVHYGGIPCEMNIICEIANRHKLFIIEDAAQGFLSTYQGRQLGTIGHIGCFSFHYTKNIICGEGGAISINANAPAYMKSRALVLWEKGTNRYDFMIGKIDKYEWIDMGSSYVPNEISCAILWAQLEQCQAITESRIQNHNRFTQGLAHLHTKGYLQLLHTLPENCVGNAHIFFIVLPDIDTRIRVQEELKIRGISAYTHYLPLHCSPAGVKYGRVGCGSMTTTVHVAECLLRLPVWVGLTEEQIEYVVESLTEIFEPNAVQSAVTD